MPETANRDFLARDGQFRALPETIDESARTVDAILSTETPAHMYDWWADRSYDEVLLADGAELPESRQIPLLDSHARWSVGDQIGSIRNVRVETDPEKGRVLVGTLHLDATERGRDAFLKVRDGHLTDMSVGYSRSEVVKLAKGEKQKINGREFDGPMEIVTKWPVREASLTPIGADSNAKIRAASRPAPPKGTERKNMPIPNDPGASQPANPAPDGGGAPAATLPPPAEPARAENPPAPQPVNVEREAAARAERQRILEIQEAGRAAQRAGFAITDAEIQAAITNCRTLEEARSDWFAVASRRSQQAPPPAIGGAERGGGHIEIGREERDSFREAASDAILLRCGSIARDKAHARAPEFAGYSLHGLMRHCYEMATGRSSLKLNAEQLMRALARPTGYRAQGRDIQCREAFGHSESDFPLILMDAMHKRLDNAYEESPATWRQLAITTSLNDLRTRYSTQLSEIPVPELVNQAGEIAEKHLTEKGENYRPGTYGQIISITREAIINDDLGAFMRLPGQIGSAFARNVNRVFWLKWLANAAMAEDSVALFDTATHGNLAAGSNRGAPSVATLTYMRTQMRTKKGLKADAILQITPSFLIVPPELYTSARQVLGSIYDPANTVNQQAINPFANSLNLVEEPELSNTSNTGASATAWYAAASPQALPCFEVGFLNGIEAPAIEEHEPFTTLGFKMRAYHDFGVGVSDWRGVFKNPNDA